MIYCADCGHGDNAGTKHARTVPGCGASLPRSENRNASRPGVPSPVIAELNTNDKPLTLVGVTPPPSITVIRGDMGFGMQTGDPDPAAAAGSASATLPVESKMSAVFGRKCR